MAQPADTSDRAERGAGPITALLGRAFATDRKCLWVLASCSVVLLRFYFARGGVSWAGDGGLHLTYAALAARAIADAELPIWTNYFASGSPFLQFYGFLFFYVVGLLDLVVGNLNLSVKMVLAAGHVLSGLTMFAFLRVALRSRPAAFVGGLGFVLTFWHTQHVLIMGRLPLSLFYAVLPLPFYAFERARVPGAVTSSAILGAISLAGLIFIHPGYAAWASVFLALYMAVRLGWRRWRRRSWRLAGAAVLLLVLGQLAGSSLTLPMWLERGSTGLAEGISLASVPDPSWRQLLNWSNFRLLLLPLPEASRNWYGGYLGLSLVVLAGIGIVGPLLARRRVRSSPVPASALGLAMALVLVLGYRTDVLQQLPLVQAFNAGRYLLFVAFFLTALSGAGALHLVGRSSHAGDLRRGTIVVLVILADLGPTTFQQPYITQRMEPLQGELPGYRSVAVTADEHRPLALTLLHWEKGVPTPQGIFDESSISYRRFAEPFLGAVAPWLRSVESLEELGGWPGGDIVYGGLRLLNTSQVYLFRGQRGRLLPAPEGVAGPVVVSARLAGPSTGETQGGSARVEALARERGMPLTRRQLRVLNVIGEMELDAQRGVAQRILVRGPAQDLETSPEVVVRSHEVGSQRVRLVLEVTQRCFARLAYSYHPHLAVSVDGERAETTETVGGYAVVELDEGGHEILIQPRLSPLRRGLVAMDVGLLGVAVALLWRRRRPASRG